MHEQWYLEFIEHYRDDIIKNWEITTVTIPTSSSSQKYNIQQQYTNQSLLSWMHHSISDSPTASHIIFTHSPKSPRGEIQPLAFSFPKIIHGEVQPNCLAFPKQTLLDLLKLWKLPPQYLHLRIRGSASGAFSRILKRNAETKRIESISFIIRVPHSVETGIKAIWSIVYTWTARTTSNKAVIDGLSPPTQSLILRFLTCSPNQASHPLSISQIIFECLVHNYTSHRNVLEQDLWKVEYTLGLTRGTQTNDSVWNQDNGFFREFTRDCNVLLTNLVYLERRLNFTSSLGHFILSSLSSLTNGDILKEDLRYTDEEIRQAVENDLSLLKNQTHQIHSLTQRTKNLLSVLNSVVTQLDSKTNTTIARETKRDSSSMITIAFITTLFLPGTFVSVSTYFLSHVLFFTSSLNQIPASR